VSPENNIFVLDSYALLAYLGGDPGQERVKELLRQAQKKQCSLQFCMINFGEVLYQTERHRGFASAQIVQAVIENLPIAIVEATRNLVLDAAHVKANHALSYADAFVVALAQRETGTILTGDPEFQTVQEQVAIEWLK
jgi:ribonuclease VapC